MPSQQKCPACSYINSPGSKFCADCGNSLSATTSDRNCPNCRAENTDDANFCFNCGEQLKVNAPTKQTTQQKQNPKRQSTKRPQNAQTSSAPLKLAALIFAGIVIYMMIPNSRTVVPKATSDIKPLAIAEQKSNNPAIENNVRDIASKFICSCGTCGEQPLDICKCATAIQERKFIRSRLQKKMKPGSIIREVNAQYGWIKPQYQEQYGAGKFRGNIKQALPVSPGLDILPDKKDIILASISDREAIISKFSCTCGQCQIDKLKDCNCDHPRGAREVKKFIDQKIQERSFSRDNIIQLVDARYGNRIRQE